MSAARAILLALVAGALAGPAPNQAQGPAEGTAPMAGPPLSLAAAVEATLAHQPAIQTARAAVDQRRGLATQTLGVFDSAILADSKLALSRKEVFGSILRLERDRRMRYEFAAFALDQAVNGLLIGLPVAGSMLFDPACTAPQTLERIERPDGSSILLCLNYQGELQGIVFDGSGGAFPDPVTRQLVDIFRDLSPALGEISQDYINYYTDLLRTLIRIFQQTSENLKISRARLGPIPEQEQFWSFSLDLAHQWRLHSGAAVGVDFALASSEDNYQGKPHDPRYGDSLVPNTFTATLGLGLDVPLGRGRGRAAVEAPWRAAEAGVQAAEYLLLQTATERVLDTVNAYYDLAAAQEALGYYEQSLASQRQVDAATREMVAGDQVPAAELSRTGARLAEVQAQVAAARQSVYQARLALQMAIGLPASRLEEAPIAADPLTAGVPTSESPPSEAAAWVRSGLAQRADLRAAAATAQASEILARAAKLNLRYPVSLSLNASYNALHETYKLPFWDFGGFQKAADDKIAGPTYGFALRFALPFHNRDARGRLVQAEASLAQSQIIETDLSRQIRLNVLDTRAALERARAEQRQSETALAHSEATLVATTEQFKGGALSVIDTLTTEQQVTQARLDVVRTRRQVAGLAAQLQFESGRLLDTGAAAGAFDATRTQLLPFAPPGAP